MKWYGFFNTSFNHIIYSKKKNLSKVKKTALSLPLNSNLNFYNTNIYVPFLWKTLILTNKLFSNRIYIYFYTKTYFFFLTLPKNFISVKYDNQSLSLIIQFFFNNNFFRLFFNYFKIIFFSFTKIFFKKLKFKGKGYYIFKNLRNTIAVQLGYSHLLYVYSYFVNVKFLSKTSVFIFGFNFGWVSNAAYRLYRVKPINIFTGKGIRFSKQLVYRKTGKMSSYR